MADADGVRRLRRPLRRHEIAPGPPLLFAVARVSYSLSPGLAPGTFIPISFDDLTLVDQNGDPITTGVAVAKGSITLATPAPAPEIAALASLEAAWPTLPEAICASLLATVLPARSTESWVG
ncbi:MAG: hypothetical protein U0835_26930 [Isosphaeraceae bacterium]